MPGRDLIMLMNSQKYLAEIKFSCLIQHSYI